jgi:hypothetical protein
MILKSAARLCSVVFLGICCSCSTGSFKRHGDVHKDFPSDLPKEIKDKFEIKESEMKATETPPPAPEATVKDSSIKMAKVENAKLKLKSKRKPKKQVVQASVQQEQPQAPPSEAPFVYPVRRPAHDPIWIGEKFVFGITYLGVSAGDFTLEALPYKTVAARKVYHLRGSAVSSPVFSLFYRVNDTVESFVDFEGLFSHRFHLILDETKQTRDSVELNDSEKKQTFFWNRLTHVTNGYKEDKVYGAIEPFSQDSMSALYFLRAVPLPNGAEVVFPVVNEGKSWDAVCTVVEREVRKTPLGKVGTIKIKLQTKYQGILQQRNGDSFLWLTDDERRIPVRFEAKVKIGFVVAVLKKAEMGVQPAPQPAAPPSASLTSVVPDSKLK